MKKTKKRPGETSYKETAFGIIPRSKLIVLELEGVKRAWNFIINRFNQGKIPITPDSLKKIHKSGFGWIFPHMAGQFRKIDVKVSNHTPPKFYTIPVLIKNLCLDLKTQINNLPKREDLDFLKKVINTLAWSHHQFLWIHPFTDYNGRIGRLLTNVILLNLNLPPIELKIATQNSRKKYIKALQLADQGNYKALEILLRSAINEAATELMTPSIEELLKAGDSKIWTGNLKKLHQSRV